MAPIEVKRAALRLALVFLLVALVVGGWVYRRSLAVRPPETASGESSASLAATTGNPWPSDAPPPKPPPLTQPAVPDPQSAYCDYPAFDASTTPLSIYDEDLAASRWTRSPGKAQDGISHIHFQAISPLAENSSDPPYRTIHYGFILTLVTKLHNQDVITHKGVRYDVGECGAFPPNREQFQPYPPLTTDSHGMLSLQGGYLYYFYNGSVIVVPQANDIEVPTLPNQTFASYSQESRVKLLTQSDRPKGLAGHPVISDQPSPRRLLVPSLNDSWFPGLPKTPLQILDRDLSPPLWNLELWGPAGRIFPEPAPGKGTPTVTTDLVFATSRPVAEMESQRPWNTTHLGFEFTLVTSIHGRRVLVRDSIPYDVSECMDKPPAEDALPPYPPLAPNSHGMFQLHGDYIYYFSKRKALVVPALNDFCTISSKGDKFVSYDLEERFKLRALTDNPDHVDLGGIGHILGIHDPPPRFLIH